jgi:hypothetical protein
MDPTNLVPSPDSIPAAAWIFEALDVLLFALHILVVDIVVGGVLLTIYYYVSQRGKPALEPPDSDRLPTATAIAVNLGVAPLLFLQVLYGHFFYTSSVLMATFWLLVIPLLILGYYGLYIHRRKLSGSPLLAKTFLVVSALALLYIGFMFVNNITLMYQPAKWVGYFENRSGTILNLGDPTLIPRYLHFVVAAVAVAGLFRAVVARYRENRKGTDETATKRAGLRIFAFGSMAQALVGFVFLATLPGDFILKFLGGDLFSTTVFLIGVGLAFAAIAAALRNKLDATLYLLGGVILAMVVNRANLRAMYLDPYFSHDALEVDPQYGVFAVFLAVLVVGVGAVAYMLRMVMSKKEASL